MSSYARTMGMRPVPFIRPRRPSGGVPVRPPGGAPIRRPVRRRRIKNAISRTQTMTKTKRRSRKGGIATDKGVSFFSYTCRPQRLPKAIYKQMIGNQQMLLQEGFQVKGTVGRQAVSGDNKLSVGSRTELMQIRDKVVPLSGGVRDPRSIKIFVKSARNVIHMRNQTNAPIKVKLFDIKCKRDTTGSANLNPVTAWQKGTDDNTQTSFPGSNHLLVGQMPGQSPEFRYFYKILKERVLELQPGAFHEHFFKINYNKMLDTTGLDNLSSSADGLSKWSFYTLVVAYGSIGNDSSTGTGAVTYLPVNLDIAYNKVYKYAYLEKNLPVYDIISTHNNALTVGQIHQIVSNDFVAAVQSAAQ